MTYESIYKKQTLSDDDTKLLFEKIVCKYSEKQDMLQFDSEKQEFEQKVKNEIDIEVDFKEYKEFLSDDFIHCKGNLASKYFMIPEQAMEAWKTDYADMRRFFIYGQSLDFETLILRMEELQKKIRALVK